MSVGAELSALVAPLVEACSSPAGADRLLRDLGVLTTPAPVPAVPPRLAALASAAESAAAALLALDDPGVPAAQRLAGLVTHLGALFTAVDDLAGVAPADLAGLDWPFDAPELWPLLARTLPGYLLGRWLRDRYGDVYEVLVLLGVLGPGADGTPVLDLAGLGTALSSASPWTEALADFAVLVAPLRRRLDARGVTEPRAPLVADDPFDPEDDFGVDPVYARGDGVDIALPGVPGFRGSVSTGAGGGGLALTVAGLDRLAGGVDAGGGWTLRGSGGPGVAGAVLGPDAAQALDTSTLDSAGLTLAGRPARPWVLLGGGAGTRLEVAAAELGLAGSRLRDDPEIAVTFAAEEVRFVLSVGDADSFLATVLGRSEVGATMRLGGRWTPGGGLDLDGAAGLEVSVDTSVAIGPVTVNGLRFALVIEDGQLALEVTTQVSGRIGPVSAAVDGMGLRLLLTPADLGGGTAGSAGGGTAGGPGGEDLVRLGPVGAALAFRPPNGVGLGVDAGVAAGGGYLYLDSAAGRYDGVIELRLLDVGISAFVIVDTAAPDVDGWSMFFALFCDLPAIQLGFGFTLTGVGGLAGINRTVDTAALESAVRSGALDAVLFPADPVADAPFVIESLRSIFPPADGQYVFGPVVRLGWGTPALVEARLGVVVALPDPVVVAVLGSVTSILPVPELDLVALHLDVAGVVDAAAGTLAVDASLHDSHIAAFALSGDMALRADFTDEPSFLLALGGFHPGFDPPGGFPALDRLRLALAAPGVLDVSFACYLALTSNTVQFGADFELAAEVAGFGISGGTEFDALISFSPFELSTRLGYYVTVAAAGLDLAGVWLDATVTGPNPWRFVGDARFTVLGLAESIHLDVRIGAPRAEPVPAAQDPREEIRAALAAAEAWSAGGSPGAGVVLSSSLGAPDPAAPPEVVAPPDGTLAVGQRVAPLGMRLDKIGDAPIGPYHTFSVEPTDPDLPATQVGDWFAPGYYVELARTEQLGAPSFEWLPAGVEFGGGEPVAGAARRATREFEEILRDPELGEDRVEQGGGAGRPGTGGEPGRRPRVGFDVAADPAAVTLRDAAYAVTHRTSGAVRGRAGTWSAAHQSAAATHPSTTIAPIWELPG